MDRLALKSCKVSVRRALLLGQDKRRNEKAQLFSKRNIWCPERTEGAYLYLLGLSRGKGKVGGRPWCGQLEGDSSHYAARKLSLPVLICKLRLRTRECQSWKESEINTRIFIFVRKNCKTLNFSGSPHLDSSSIRSSLPSLSLTRLFYNSVDVNLSKTDSKAIYSFLRNGICDYSTIGIQLISMAVDQFWQFQFCNYL